MPATLCFHIHCGKMEYGRCLQLQQAAAALRQQDRIGDCVLVVEHDHVFTIGRSGSRANLHADAAELASRGVACIDVERGGDITYHGPGQLVIYPIVKIPAKGWGVADFIGLLEEAMIALLASFGVTGHTDGRNRGVWVNGRKIGFVGISVRRGVSMHGLALNVAPALDFFRMINPCGLKNVAITSMAEILAEPPSLTEVAQGMGGILARSLTACKVEMSITDFLGLLEMEDAWHMQRA